MNTNSLALRQEPDSLYAAPSVNSPEKDALHFTVSVNHSPLLKWQNSLLKRVFDVVVSVIVMLTLLSWLLPLLALAIKMDSRGPVFFIQNRNKKNGNLFRCIKLRTMTDEKSQRITAVGRLLRWSHLDELPQFVNVLAGDMSVIGPRPHMVAENVQYAAMISCYSYRHTVKPGITGLAQSLGYHGPAIDLQHIKTKTAYDIHYINNWSFSLDVKILMRTVAGTRPRSAIGGHRQAWQNGDDVSSIV